jgi:hypothetical protein
VVQIAKVIELEVMTRLSANKIAELEVTCTDLKRGKDKLTDGSRRLVGKHKLLEQDMAKLAEVVAAELTKLCDDLDLETHSYTKYC